MPWITVGQALHWAWAKTKDIPLIALNKLQPRKNLKKRCSTRILQVVIELFYILINGAVVVHYRPCYKEQNTSSFLFILIPSRI
jgi:hypothetical protein